MYLSKVYDLLTDCSLLDHPSYISNCMLIKSLNLEQTLISLWTALFSHILRNSGLCEHQLISNIRSYSNNFDIYDKVSSFFLLDQISQFWRNLELPPLTERWKRDTLLKVREHFHIFHPPGTKIEKCFLSSIFHIRK